MSTNSMSVWESSLSLQFLWSLGKSPWLPCAILSGTPIRPVCSSFWPMCYWRHTTISEWLTVWAWHSRQKISRAAMMSSSACSENWKSTLPTVSCRSPTWNLLKSAVCWPLCCFPIRKPFHRWKSYRKSGQKNWRIRTNPEKRSNSSFTGCGRHSALSRMSSWFSPRHLATNSTPTSISRPTFSGSMSCALRPQKPLLL